MNKQKIAVEVAALGAAASGVCVLFISYRARTRRSLFALLFRLVGAGEFVLTRKTLLGIKQRAERASKQAPERASVAVQ